MTNNYFDRWLDGMFGAIGATDTTPKKNYTITVKHQNLNTTPSFEIRSVLSNRHKNAFTVVWTDGTHTTVHCQPGDDWDDEKALAMCFTKKALGNKGNFNDKFNDALAHMKTIPASEEKPIPAVEVADKPDITIDGKWRIVDRPVKVGDYIRLKTDGEFSFSRPGDILLASQVTCGLVEVKAKDHPRDTDSDPEYLWSYMPSEYDVVEPIKREDDAANAMADALTRLTENAHETAKNIGETLAEKLEKSGLTEKINELCASTSPEKVEANPCPKKDEITLCGKDLGRRYNVYHYGIFTESRKLLFTAKTIEEVRKFISEDSEKRGYCFYTRLWNGKSHDLYIDYGSHTHYYHITGTNIEEYTCN